MGTRTFNNETVSVVAMQVIGVQRFSSNDLRSISELKK